MKSNLRFRLIAALCVLLASAAASAFEKTWDDYMEAGYQALQQRQYAEAEKQFKFALQEAEDFEALDPRRAATLNDLGEALRMQAKYAEAEPLCRRALQILEKTLGPDHLDIAPVLNTLGLVYASQGKYTLAEQVHKRSLAIKEKALGPEHPNITRSLRNLARLYRDQEEAAQKIGLELLKDVGETYRSLKRFHFEGVVKGEVTGEGLSAKVEISVTAAMVRPDKIRIGVDPKFETSG